MIIHRHKANKSIPPYLLEEAVLVMSIMEPSYEKSRGILKTDSAGIEPATPDFSGTAWRVLKSPFFPGIIIWYDPRPIRAYPRLSRPMSTPGERLSAGF